MAAQPAQDFDGYATIVDDLFGTAKDTNTAASTIGAGLDALKAYCNSLNGPWIGPAEGAFQDLMIQFQANAAALHDALTNIAAELNQNAVNYEQGEATNMKQVMGLQQAMPRLNL